MCLILFSYDTHPLYRLVLASNRDEFYTRPTLPLTYWDKAPNILAGRDLLSHGTWLGITRTGRISAITNYRDPASQKINAPSRGLLVSSFLAGNESSTSYFEYIKKIGHKYNGFNMLIGKGPELFYYSNVTNRIKTLKPGLYGLSNHLIDTPWPKVEQGKAALKAALSAKKQINLEDIFTILKNSVYPPDNMLPDTGIGLERERILSPLFVTSIDYGTRSSSIILIERTGKVTFAERTFILEDPNTIEHKTLKFSFMISDIPPFSDGH